ncbi:hypothetical protein M422DRAFT_32084 [Sphaerobolus stellatus SS14]|uniref:Unplaced genomic scaffold SPHSTscaffold_65, whole genome shotgun sequence n=1 Tax=Sphaerobolus stellatus (strain SS14) TaxID=990650 RepID=A0A0C9V1R4_SPHS4|nr:hypothetical protein M422DRAFT_32084 [Sphaerobolus stellatus SS14]
MDFMLKIKLLTWLVVNSFLVLSDTILVAHAYPIGDVQPEDALALSTLETLRGSGRKTRIRGSRVCFGPSDECNEVNAIVIIVLVGGAVMGVAGYILWKYIKARRLRRLGAEPEFELDRYTTSPTSEPLAPTRRVPGTLRAHRSGGHQTGNTTMDFDEPEATGPNLKSGSQAQGGYYAPPPSPPPVYTPPKSSRPKDRLLESSQAVS